jgi:nitroreductase
MEFYKVIKERISIRKYQKKNIDDSQIDYILECGHAAPTAGNLQPWEFIIIKDIAMKKKIINTTFVGNQKNSLKHQQWLIGAPVFIVVCADKDRISSRYGEEGEESVKKLAYLDCSACIENMLLAVVDLKLGSCYISGFKEDKLAKALKLPPHLEAVAFIPIGYIKGNIIKCSKRPLKEVIHREFYKK